MCGTDATNKKRIGENADPSNRDVDHFLPKSRPS